LLESISASTQHIMASFAHKLKKKYYSTKRFLNENIFVSIPTYKKIDLEKPRQFYAQAIANLKAKAKHYEGQTLPTGTTRFENFSFELSLSDVTGDILTQKTSAGVRYFRGINHAYTPFFQELYSTGLLQAFIEEGRVVNIIPTPYFTEEYPLIFEVETLKVVNPSYWSFSMIKESAINLLLVDMVLMEYGYGIIDGHPFNSTFKNGRPIMFDVGSFIRRKSCQFTGEMIHYYLHTLMMMSTNRSHFSKHNIMALNMPITSSVGKGISLEKKAIIDTFFKHHQQHSSKGFNAILSELMNEKITKPEYIDVVFSSRLEASVDASYHDPLFDEHATADVLNERQVLSTLVSVIQRFSPHAKSTLDLAGNAGYLSYLLAQTGQFNSVINLDRNEDAIEYGIKKLRNEKVTCYHVNPIAPFGDLNSFSKSVKSDVVVVLKLTHHLIIALQYKIHAILSIYAKYTAKDIYIEFLPLGEHPSQASNLPSWYTEHWFEEKFNLFFDLKHKEVLETVNINGEEKPKRIIFVGEKKEQG
jgi:hypothetical protein